MNRKKWAIFFCVCAVLGALGLGLLYRSQHPYALKLKKFVKYEVLHMAPSTQKGETIGLPDGWDVTLYVNGQPRGNGDFDYMGDNKRVYAGDEVCRLVNYSDGYQMDFPVGTQFDFSLSAAVTEGRGEGYEFTVSREYSPYESIEQAMADGLAQLVPWFRFDDGIDQYIGYYQSRFLLNEGWQQNNRVEVSQTQELDANGHKAILYHAVMQEMPQDKYDAYSYVYIRTGGRDFIRVVVKYRHENTALRDSLPQLFAQFRTFDPVGQGVVQTDFKPVLPENWSEETRELYHRIADSDDLRWGIFVEDIYGKGIEETVPALEQKLDYRFPVILSYVHSIHDFPTEFMQKNWEQGRIVELTYQLTENNNEDMFGYSPALDLYRGLNEEMVRRFARQAKEFGHPFLLRLCNEMNSDWTSYGGVVNMGDPDIFVENWRTFYRIFQEEGVNNCIWIFNPNDRNAPPCRWNDSLNYYPGNEYVQMIGVTGYNNGTYYTQWAEEWREFDVIYDHIQQLYGTTFGQFPWIITEFASSSIGGDKVAWIDNMFQHIQKYPNIKIAVWFSYADWDAQGNVARPYWLDETEETTQAFRKGLQNYTREGWTH